MGSKIGLGRLDLFLFLKKNRINSVKESMRGRSRKKKFVFSMDKMCNGFYKKNLANYAAYRVLINYFIGLDIAFFLLDLNITKQTMKSGKSLKKNSRRNQKDSRRASYKGN